MTDTTEAVAAIRARVERIQDRHEPGHSEDYDDGGRCMSCGGRWPCDAYQLADDVLALVTALEMAEGSLVNAYERCQALGLVSDFGIDVAYAAEQINAALISRAAQGGNS